MCFSGSQAVTKIAPRRRGVIPLTGGEVGEHLLVHQLDAPVPPFRFEEVLYPAAYPPIQVGDEPRPRRVEVDHGVQQLPAGDGHGIVHLRFAGTQAAADALEHVFPAAYSVVEKRRRDSSLHG